MPTQNAGSDYPPPRAPARPDDQSAIWFDCRNNSNENGNRPRKQMTNQKQDRGGPNSERSSSEICDLPQTSSQNQNTLSAAAILDTEYISVVASESFFRATAPFSISFSSQD